MQPTTAATLGYRPHLDGLRAFAVYLVVAFHAGLDQLHNGFIGVDIFFVLSGYLVTAILVRDLQSSTGKIGFGSFYGRRIKRLLPAALLNLTATALIFGAIATPLQLAEAEKGIRAAALYFANWHFIAQSADYFAADVLHNPVQHYWSLSVEEQYYFAWPVLMAVAWSLAGRAGVNRMRTIQFMALIGAVLSYLLARYFASTELNRAYYGSDSRAYQLLIGGLLALTPGLMTRIRASFQPHILAALAIAAFAFLCILSTPILDMDPIWRGLQVTLAAAALIIFLDSSPSGPVCSALSRPSIVYLGKISYGTYLWHWLTIIVLSHFWTLSPALLVLIAAILSTALASISFHFLEHPIRSRPIAKNARYIPLAIGLTLSLLLGLVISPWILDRIYQQSDIATRSGINSGNTLPSGDEIWDAWTDIYRAKAEGCVIGAESGCLISQRGPRTAIVVGDSHAATFTPMLTEVTARHDITLYAGFLKHCPWPAGMRYTVAAGQQCFTDQEKLYNEIIPKLDPDIVFLAHRAVDDPNREQDIVDQSLGLLRSKTWKHGQAVAQRSSAVIEALRKDGRTVVFLEPFPIVAIEDNTLTCLQKAKSLDDCSFKTRTGRGIQESAIRKIGEKDPKVISLDLDRLVCPNLPICDPIVNKLIVRRDDNHLTRKFANSLADEVEAMLIEDGVLGSGNSVIAE